MTDSDVPHLQRERALVLVPMCLLLIFRLWLPPNLCDDAYITFRAATNAAHGGGLGFNYDQRIYAVTTPAWGGLLAGANVLGADVAVAARIFGILFELLLVWAMVHFGRLVTGSPALGMLGAVLLVANPVFLLTSFSGMELPLYLLCITLSFILFERERYALCLLVGAAALWVRFDGLGLYGTLGLCYLARKRRAASIKAVLPSVGLFAAYVAFGHLYYGDVVPVSVQRKAAGTAMFSAEWFDGARGILNTFFHALVGRSNYWYEEASVLYAFPLLVVCGIVLAVRARNRRLLVAGVYSVLYILAYTSSGRSFATNFPWYFVPPLIVACVLGAMGLVWLVGLVSRRELATRGILVIALVWAGLMVWPMKDSAKHLSKFALKRERAYAAAGVWLGNHLAEGASVA
ncbi:hypothetical protein HQ560_18345, partial [bacterium]|nr:hypothetical protein [bacterium]